MSQSIDVSNAAAPVKEVQRWQFSTRALLVLMTVCCAIMTVVVVPPIGIIVLSLVAIALAMFCPVAAIYGRGWIRPFSIATGVSLIFSFFISLEASPDGAELLIVLFMLLVGSIFIGMCSAAMHGFLKRRLGVVPIPNVPFLRDWLWNPEVDA